MRPSANGAVCLRCGLYLQANFLGLGVLLIGAAVGVSWYNKRNGNDSMSHAHSHG